MDTWNTCLLKHGNQFKSFGQESFKYVFALFSNKRHHILSNFKICCCIRNTLYHLMVIFLMLKWYKLLYYKEILAIIWMTLI